MAEQKQQQQTQEPQRTAAAPGYTGEMDPTTLEAWKKQYKAVHRIEVVGEQDAQGNPTLYYVGYLRGPNRNHIANAMSYVKQNLLVEAGEVLLANCWLGGAEVLRDDDPENELYTGACMGCYDILEIPDASAKKL
jgi:hypothetical protein